MQKLKSQRICKKKGSEVINEIILKMELNFLSAQLATNRYELETRTIMFFSTSQVSLKNRLKLLPFLVGAC